MCDPSIFRSLFKQVTKQSIDWCMHASCNTSIYACACIQHMHGQAPPRLDLMCPFGWRLDGSCLCRWRGRSLRCQMLLLQIHLSSLKAQLVQKTNQLQLSCVCTGQICFVYLRVYIYLYIHIWIYEWLLHDPSVLPKSSNQLFTMFMYHVGMPSIFRINCFPSMAIPKFRHMVPKVRRTWTQNCESQSLWCRGSPMHCSEATGWVSISSIGCNASFEARRAPKMEGKPEVWQICICPCTQCAMQWFACRTRWHDSIIWKHTKQIRVRMLNLKKNI